MLAEAHAVREAVSGQYTAGLLGDNVLLYRDPDVLEEELRVNTVAPLYLLQKPLPLIRKGAANKILFLSSCMGSVQNAPFFVGCTESYSVTKAGLNMYVQPSARVGRDYQYTSGSGANGVHS